MKVGILLAETSLRYEAHRIAIMADDRHDPVVPALNPNGKIPAIHDPDRTTGSTRLALFGSGGAPSLPVAEPSPGRVGME